MSARHKKDAKQLGRRFLVLLVIVAVATGVGIAGAEKSKDWRNSLFAGGIEDCAYYDALSFNPFSPTAPLFSSASSESRTAQTFILGRRPTIRIPFKPPLRSPYQPE